MILWNLRCLRLSQPFQSKALLKKKIQIKFELKILQIPHSICLVPGLKSWNTKFLLYYKVLVFSYSSSPTTVTHTLPGFCEVCGAQGFFTLPELRQHKKTAHPSGESTCEHCGAHFKNLAWLRRHMAEVHMRTRPFECGLCELKFKRREHLRDHIKVKHKDNQGI